MKLRTLFGIAAAAVMLVYAQDTAPQTAPQKGAGGGGRGGDSKFLPTKEQWDSNPKTQEYGATAQAIAGEDPDLKFDAGIFSQASGGATNQDRATIGVPDSLPHLTPFPAPNPNSSSTPSERKLSISKGLQF